MAPFLQSLLTFASLASLSSAFVVHRSSSSNATPTLPLNEVAPQNTGTAGLPQPTVRPSAITLGIGYQNYTCANGVYIQTGQPNGALAELFNIGNLVNSKNIDTISPTALKAFEKCSSGSDYIGCHHSAIQAVDWSPDHIGQHFFSPVNGAQIPHFALDEARLYLSAKRAGGVLAPANAYKGQNGLGAVAWLYLVDDGESYTRGLKSVYRVETAGGTAPSFCSVNQDGQPLNVPYVAQYWFYD